MRRKYVDNSGSLWLNFILIHAIPGSALRGLSLNDVTYFSYLIIGAICCRVQTKGRKSWAKKEIHIQTFGVLERFRCQVKKKTKKNQTLHQKKNM